MSSRTDAATFPDQADTGKIDAAEQQKRGENIPRSGQRRTTMHSMNASYFIEKVGHGILNAFLLAALPTALVATLIQAL
jgi:hypothetical protein